MTPDQARWAELVDAFGFAGARRIDQILDGHPIRREKAEHWQRARAAFARLRAAGWPDKTRARSIRKMAKVCEIDPHTARRWLEQEKVGSGAHIVDCPTS